MLQTLTIPPILLDWSDWVAWKDLQQSTAVVAPRPGVYEVKRKSDPDDALRLHIGMATKLRFRVRQLVTGRMHSTGQRILAVERAEALDDLVVRWAATVRPAAAEEELHRLHRQDHGGQMPFHDIYG